MAANRPQEYAFPEPMTQSTAPPGLNRPLPEPPMKGRAPRGLPGKAGPPPAAPTAAPMPPTAPPPMTFQERVLARYIQPARFE